MRRLAVGVVAATTVFVAIAAPTGADVARGPVAPSASAGTYASLVPARILDTRNGTGGLGTFAAHQSQNLLATGVGGVPAAGVDAVALNVTATNPSAPGHLTLFPAGQTLPNASNLNFAPGQTVANLVVVKVGHGVGNEGQVSISNTNVSPGPQPPAGTVDVVADVVGWFSDGTTTGAEFTGLVPTRILDTRIGVGLLGSFAPHQMRNLLVGDGGAPSDAVAVVINVTATNPSTAGHLTVFPAGQPLPSASSLNFAAGQTVANLVIVKVGTNTEVTISNTNVPTGTAPPAGTVDVVADLVGYYKAGVGADLSSITPVRVLDTRTGPGAPLGPNATTTVDPRAGSSPVPAGATAVVANVTATAPTQAGHLTAFPSDSSLPLASTLNFASGQTVPNLVEIRVGADGKFKIANTASPSAPQPPSGTVHVVVDIVGYLTGNAGSTPPPPTPLAPPPPSVSLPAGSPTLNQSVLVNTSTGLNRPWDLAFLPGTVGPISGSYPLYTENDAKTIDAYMGPGEPRRVLFTDNDIDTNGEGGTMGIAVHPDYPTNKSVYVCQTSLSGGDNRVVKYTLTVDGSGNPVALTNATPIITGMLKNSFHNGCRLRFQPGASPPALFVTMGDAGSGPSPQDPNGLNGKVLRVDENGNAYPGNPFGKRWYTRGHRNPQGIAFRPGTNQPYSSEHGPNINDEVNALMLGGNAGWEPNTNGTYDQGHTMTDLTKASVIRPQWRSGDSVTIAPSGMTFLQNIGAADWKTWQGNIVLAVLKNMELRMLTVDGSGNVTGQVQIAQVTPTPKRLRVPVLGPDGKLYATTDENPGQILVFTPS